MEFLREAADDDAQMLHDLIDTFVKHSDQVMLGLARALIESDLEAIRRYAHTIKGSALAVGAPGLAQAAAVVEKLAREERRDDLGEALDALASTYEAVRAALHRIARDPGGSGF